MSTKCIVRPTFAPPYARNAKKRASVATVAIDVPMMRTVVNAR